MPFSKIIENGKENMVQQWNKKFDPWSESARKIQSSIQDRSNRLSGDKSYLSSRRITYRFAYRILTSPFKLWSHSCWFRNGVGHIRHWCYLPKCIQKSSERLQNVAHRDHTIIRHALTSIWPTSKWCTSHSMPTETENLRLRRDSNSGRWIQSPEC